jgi:hypothetical protein
MIDLEIVKLLGFMLYPSLRARGGGKFKYLFSGMLICGVCNSNVVMVNSERYGCGGYKAR